MAPELDVGMSMGMGIGVGMMPMGLMGMDGGASSSFSTAYLCGLPTTDGLPIDDLLDFSNQDDLFDSTVPGYAAESHQSHHPLPSHGSAAPAVGSFDTSGSNLSTFSDDLYVPSEEAAELEWLSKFVDDSFADVPFPSSPGGCGNGLETIPSSISGGLRGDPSAIPGRARSKRSRAPAAALQHPTSTWSTPEPPQPSAFSMSPTSSSSSLLEFPPCSATSKLKAAAAACGGRKKEMAAGPGMESGVRRCTHCSSEKTPQWRSGPLGPKTLCNACGVRYKSGRLVPEYRPAASPTFVFTKHSNSHRKVMELRRQKELILRHHGGGSAATSPSSRPELLFHDYKVS